MVLNVPLHAPQGAHGAALVLVRPPLDEPQTRAQGEASESREEGQTPRREEEAMKRLGWRTLRQGEIREKG